MCENTGSGAGVRCSLRLQICTVEHSEHANFFSELRLHVAPALGRCGGLAVEREVFEHPGEHSKRLEVIGAGRESTS